MKLHNIVSALPLAVALSLSSPSSMAYSIDNLVHAGENASQEAQSEAAARHFYTFWDTGDEGELGQAIGATFTDHTLPPGRPQGPKGPATASRTFRQAVPDLAVHVREMIVAGDYVTTHMVFSGHFTGIFPGSDGQRISGQGQAIEFIATDLVKVANGRITDNWHLEDNLTLLSRMGLVKTQ